MVFFSMCYIVWLCVTLGLILSEHLAGFFIRSPDHTSLACLYLSRLIVYTDNI